MNQSQGMFHGGQLEAIRHVAGPMMVLAGPGSGKTTVITHRTKGLIQDCQIDPSSILVITFTKAAATEMKERFDKLMGGSAVQVNFGTFHSVFFRILKLAYGYGPANIARDEQRMAFMRQLMDRHRLEVEEEGEFAASILAEISSVKGELLDMKHYCGKNCPHEIFKLLYEGYEDLLRRANLLDFDDMLVMCFQLLKERQDILGAWQKKYRYLLVDEFQDINRVQYEILRMLARPEDNLFIVGDDDQSIYRFRGAKPEIMLGFQKDYPGARRVLLDVNYRCTQDIAKAAARVISHNKARFPKNISTVKGPGKPVATKVWQDPQEETREVARQIKDYVQAGFRFSDIAVLYRTNLGPRLLMERLMEHNIPFCTKDAVPNLYNHWIAQNVLAYIQVARGGLERARVLQIINRPKRYVSRDALEGSRVSWNAVKSFYMEKDWMVERIQQLEHDLSMVAAMAPGAAVNYIRKAIGYESYVKEHGESRGVKPEELLEVLDQLQESAYGFKTYETWFRHMEEYDKQLKAQALQQNQVSDGVSLMTMHGSKGLEYPIVYILDANEGVTPHPKALLEADLEEERRMFYVAMTRARQRLHVCYVKERYHKKQEVSRFVMEYLEG